MPQIFLKIAVFRFKFKMIHSKRLQYGFFSYTVNFSESDFSYLKVRDLSAKTRVRTRRGGAIQGRLIVTRILAYFRLIYLLENRKIQSLV